MKKLIYSVLAACAVFALASCKQAEVEQADSLEISTSEMGFTNFGGTQTITFTASTAWTASTDASWLTISPESGEAGSATISVKADQNNESDSGSRSGNVTITAGSKKTSFKVTQNNQNVFNTSTEISLDSKAQQFTVILGTNTDYEVVISDDAKDWIKRDPSVKSITLESYQFNVSANSGLQTRSGSISFLANDGTGRATYVVKQSSDFIETTLADAAYYGMAEKIYDDEAGEYLEDYDEFALFLLTGESSGVVLAFNVEPGGDKTVIPTGDFEASYDGAHAPATISFLSEGGYVGTCIIVDEEPVYVADGTLSIEKDDEGNYYVAAALMDENEEIKRFSYVGPIDEVLDASLAAVVQECDYLGAYATYFTTKATKYDLWFSVSRALEEDGFNLSYVSLDLYGEAGADPTAVPYGTYTLAEGNEIPVDESVAYASGNYNANPGTFVWYGNSKNWVSYDQNRIQTEIQDGATVSIYNEDGVDFIEINAKLRDYYYEVEWDDEWEYWSYKYDEDWNPIAVYGEWFDYNAKIPFTSELSVTDNAAPITPNEDTEFTYVNINPAYIGFWFGDANGLGGSDYYFGWSTGVNGNYAVQFVLHSEAVYVPNTNYASRYSDAPVPNGTYTYSATKPAQNGDYIVNSAGAYKCMIVNGYTGTSFTITGGTVTITDDGITLDLTAQGDGKEVKFTGTLGNTPMYIRDYSAAKYAKYVKWAE